MLNAVILIDCQFAIERDTEMSHKYFRALLNIDAHNYHTFTVCYFWPYCVLLKQIWSYRQTSPSYYWNPPTATQMRPPAVAMRGEKKPIWIISLGLASHWKWKWPRGQIRRWSRRSSSDKMRPLIARPIPWCTVSVFLEQRFQSMGMIPGVTFHFILVLLKLLTAWKDRRFEIS